jgi:hypothetical protein
MVSGEKAPPLPKTGALCIANKNVCSLLLPSGLYRRHRILTGSAALAAPFAGSSAKGRITAGVEFHHPLKQGHYSAARGFCQFPHAGNTRNLGNNLRFPTLPAFGII